MPKNVTQTSRDDISCFSYFQDKTLFWNAKSSFGIKTVGSDASSYALVQMCHCGWPRCKLIPTVKHNSGSASNRSTWCLHGNQANNINHVDSMIASFPIFHIPRRVQCAHAAINSLRPRQNGRYNADDTFKCIFLNENVWIPTKIPLKFVSKGPINNIPALVQIMAWRRPGGKPLSELMMVSLLTHICVTRPQWVN